MLWMLMEAFPLEWAAADAGQDVDLQPNQALPCGFGPGNGPLKLTAAEIQFLEEVSSGIDRLDRINCVKRNESASIDEFIRSIERYGNSDQKGELQSYIERIDHLTRIHQRQDLNRTEQQQSQIKERASDLMKGLEAFVERAKRKPSQRMDSGPMAKTLADWLVEFPLSKMDLVQPNNISTGQMMGLFDFDENSDKAIRTSLRIVGAILPAIYGGVHLTAWNFEFPSETEALLWHISGLIIAMGLPVYWTLKPILDHVPARALFLILVICYGLSRFYLIVESFVSLRRVPIGVFWAPSWIQMLPHL